MTTFVLIPGGWCGAWYFQPIAQGLRLRGHKALAITLSGLAERSQMLGGINLQRHVDDVLEVLEAEQLADVVLLGHSYAGMVVSGVLDRAAHRVAAAIYCDAYVPRDGESCFELANDRYRKLMLDGARFDGVSVAPPRGSDPRTTAHPLGSFLQALTLTSDVPTIPRGFVFLSGWSATPFAPSYERVRQDPAWRCFSLPIGHDVVRDAPDELVNIALQFA